MYYKMKYRSPIGNIIMISDDRHILGAWFEGEKLYLYGLGPITPEEQNAAPLNMARKWLDAYFTGLNPPIADLPLKPQGTPFQKSVWDILRKIPYGSSITYGQIAKEISEINHARMSAQAVGQAVGHNPISILIPCHRVLGANAKLTGYAGGLEKKRFLLNLEGIQYKE